MLDAQDSVETAEEETSKSGFSEINLKKKNKPQHQCDTFFSGQPNKKTCSGRDLFHATRSSGRTLFFPRERT